MVTSLADTRPLRRIALCLGLLALASARAQFPVGPPSPPKTAKAAALYDLTGYWVSVVTEDWRFRLVMPPKGDYTGVFLNPEGRKVADAWDPAKDAAAGEQCKSYGAPILMSLPGRLHITWQDDQALKIEADAGQQTRLLHFTSADDPGPSLARILESALGDGARGPRRRSGRFAENCHHASEAWIFAQERRTL